MNCPNCKLSLEGLVLTIKEAAEFVGFKYTTFRSKICNEEVPYIGPPHKRRFLKSDLMKWIEFGMPDNYQLLKAGKIEEIKFNGEVVGWRFK